MIKEYVFAGFGGQGVLTAGMILAHAGAAKGLDVTWIPSYGAEMRGGTANCTVKIGDEEVPSPFPGRPDVLVAMNEPSLNKFKSAVKVGGHIIINSSIIHSKAHIPGVNVYRVDMGEIASGLGSERSANLCALGAAMACESDMLDVDDISEAIRSYLKKAGNNDTNVAVMKAGYNAVRSGIIL